MSFLYTLNLLDPTDLPCVGLDTRRFTSLDQADSLVQLLKDQSPGANPRFERLLVLAEREFPDKVRAMTGRTGQPVGVAGQPPRLHGEGKTGALLTLAVDSGDLSSIMPELLCWSRELGLDVFDEVRRVFLPWRGKPLPLDPGMEYVRASGWGRPLRVWSSAMDLRQMVIDRLTRRLSKSGWVFLTEPGFDAVFVRAVPDGYQRISARLTGELPALSCEIVVEQGSQWLTKAMREVGYPLGNPKGLNKALQLNLSEFRVFHNPGWERWRETNHVALAWSDGWLDWMLNDMEMQVLPVLDKAQTVEGLYGLYLDPVSSTFFPDAVPQNGAINPDLMEVVLTLAYGCNHGGLDELVLRMERQLTQQNLTSQLAVVTKLVAALRRLPQNVVEQAQ